MASSSGSNFVHLHLHTDYSLLDGACEIGELTAEAARRGMPAVAVTDHGNLFAAANFYHQATTHGVKPIIGCEVYVAPDNHKNRGAEAERSNHLVLLCENDEGYRNLIQLVSTGFLDGFYYKPRVDHELLARHSKGLIALSACLRGEVADALMSEKYDQARTNAYRLRDIFGKGNFFLEVQDQGLEVETRINRDLVHLSRETGIPLVATNDCHYLTQHGRPRPGSADVHPDRQDHERRRADEIRDRPVLFQDRRRNGACISRAARRRFAHGGDRRALQRENPARQQSVPRIQSSRRPHHGFVFRESGARGFCTSRRAARTALATKAGCGIRLPNTRAGLPPKSR